MAIDESQTLLITRKNNTLLYSKGSDLEIGSSEPADNQKPYTHRKINKHIAAGLLNGFWNFVVFSNKGTNSRIPGRDAIEMTPMIFEGKTLNRSKLARKYHSGKISKGVANGFAFSAIAYG